MEDITNQLVNQAGIRPSREWLNACQEYLQQTSTTSSLHADAILHQILHTDLRDVVVAEDPESTRLKDTTRLSMTNESRKATLDASFQLMIQVEELLDVSLNAEARLEQGPAPATAPTPIGNQQKRCLKLLLQDGHVASSAQTGDTINLVAMEVVPIRDLSVNSRAGIKVLLKGPIEIRYGILMLNPQNAIVLGGSVDELVEIQRKAMEQASRVAGIGIDPTMRALVWNPLTGSEPQEEEEGEAASGDVVAAPPQPPPRQSRTNSSYPPQTSQNQNSSNQALPRGGSTAPVPPRPPPPPQQPFNPPPPQQQLRSHPATSNQTFGRGPGMDAARRSAPQTVSRPADARSFPSTVTPVPRSTAPPKANPYARSSSTSSSRATHSQQPSRESLTSSQESNSVPSVNSNQNSCERVLSYQEFLTKTQQMIQDRRLYQEAEGTIFTVMSKGHGRPSYFDIAKKKKRKNTDEKKKSYEYIVNASLRGAQEESLFITVRFSGNILGPHFERPAQEMRKLSKTNRGLVDKLVTEGGHRVMETLNRELKPWKVSLRISASEYFEQKPSLDGKDPIWQVLE